jgi:hypothetical protein
MPINCKGINASGIHIPKSGIKYNQFIIVIRGEPINLVWPLETPITHGMWLNSEKGNSSTWKELTAVKQVLLSVIHILSGKRIKWFTDNLNKFKYNIRYTPVVMITNYTKIMSSIVL